MQRYYYMIQRGGRYALGLLDQPQQLVTTASQESETLQRLWLRAENTLTLAERGYLERLLEMAESTHLGFELGLSESEYQRIFETLQKKAHQDVSMPPTPDSPDMAPPPRLESPTQQPSTSTQGQLSFLDAKAQIAIPEVPKSSGGTRNHPTIDAWPDPMDARDILGDSAKTQLAPYDGQQSAKTEALAIQQGILQHSLLGRWQQGKLLSLKQESSGDLLFTLEDHETLARLIKLRDLLREQDPLAAELCSPIDLLLAAIQNQPPTPPQHGQSYFLYQPIHLYRRLFGSWLPEDSAQELHALFNEQIDAEECFLCLGRPFRQQKIGQQRGSMGSFRGEIKSCWVVPLLQDPSADLFEKLMRDTKMRCSLYDQNIGKIGEMSFFFRLLQQLGLSPRLLIEEMEGMIPFDSLCRLLEVERPHASPHEESDPLLPLHSFEEEEDDDF